MLRKVFKYDLKATARLFIPMYIVFFLITIANKVFFELVALNNTINEVLSTLTASLTILYVIAIIAIFVTTFIFIKTLWGIRVILPSLCQLRYLPISTVRY